MKNFVKILFMFCLILPLGFVVTACGKGEPENVMTMSVNPSVSFVLDSNNNVASVMYENDDASTIYANVDFVGKNLDATIQLFIEQSAISGHINLTGDDVTINVSGSSEVNVDALKEQAKTKVEEVFKSLGITVTVKLDDLDKAAQKAALVAKAKVLAPEKSAKELDEMTNEQLVAIINEKQQQLEGLAYSQVAAVKDQFSAAKNTILQTVQTLQATLESVQKELDDLNATLSKYGDLIPEAVKTQINSLQAQVKDLQQKITTNVNNFLKEKEAEINKAKAKYAEIKAQIETEFKTQVETAKGNVINHLETSKNNGTITEEQYNYWVNLINNQAA